MKIVRLQAGYRITLSDSEFEALQLMLSNPDALERDAHEHLSNSAKAVIRREPFTSIGGPLVVTENRRR